jgi:hypothetical protein
MAVGATVRAYRAAMSDFAKRRTLDVWHTRMDGEDLRARLTQASDGRTRHEIDKRMLQSSHRDHLAAFERFVERTEAGIRFGNHPPILTTVEALLEGEQRDRYVEVVRAFLQQYRESLRPDRRVLLESYLYVHMARKVVGVGSVGTSCWVVLLVGRDDDDPLFLQLKEAQQSVLAPYLGDTTYECQGRRVVEGQRLMQSASDDMLGWYGIQGWDGNTHDFYARQLWDGKASIDVTRLTPAGLRIYGESCAWTLARAHARSGERIAIAAYVNDDSFDEALAQFASSYADTNEADHSRLVTAIADGQIDAVAGV